MIKIKIKLGTAKWLMLIDLLSILGIFLAFIEDSFDQHNLYRNMIIRDNVLITASDI